MHLKISCAKWRPFCPGGDELNCDQHFRPVYLPHLGTSDGRAVYDVVINLWNLFLVRHGHGEPRSKWIFMQRADIGKAHADVIKWKPLRRYITGSSWEESTGDRWIPLIRASDADLWCFLWSAPEQMVEQTVKTLVIWDANALIMTSL